MWLMMLAYLVVALGFDVVSFFLVCLFLRRYQLHLVPDEDELGPSSSRDWDCTPAMVIQKVITRVDQKHILGQN
eukprot:m.80647 g.80647  ORF g.80647 m.80647 type:complete len:74 (+) comp14216_c0_seq5:1417-1638(+)